MPTPALTGRWRLASRVAAAVFGGYALASACMVLLAALLPPPRAEGVLAAMQLSFAIYTGAVVWAFAVHDLRRAWAGLLAPAVVLAGMGLLLAGAKA